jgi:hypothetical protein
VAASNTNMRLSAVLFIAALLAAPAARAQQATSSPAEDGRANKEGQQAQPQGDGSAAARPDLNLPVSLDKIKEALAQTPPVPLLKIDERPTFRVQIHERQKIEELLATLNFKNTTPPPAGGIYMQEQNRIMFNPVDHPLVQPYAAFNQAELLTILIENLAGRYLAGKAADSISKAERARAEAQAREEVRTAVAEYCDAQPNGGTGLQICSSVGR